MTSKLKALRNIHKRRKLQEEDLFGDGQMIIEIEENEEIESPNLVTPILNFDVSELNRNQKNIVEYFQIYAKSISNEHDSTKLNKRI